MTLTHPVTIAPLCNASIPIAINLICVRPEESVCEGIRENKFKTLIGLTCPLSMHECHNMTVSVTIDIQYVYDIMHTLTDEMIIRNA